MMRFVAMSTPTLRSYDFEMQQALRSEKEGDRNVAALWAA